MTIESNNSKIWCYILCILVLKFISPVIHLYCIFESPFESKTKIRSHSISVNNYGRAEFLILCRCVLNKEDKEKRGEMVSLNYSIQFLKSFLRTFSFVLEICLHDVFSHVVLPSLGMLQLL